MTHSDTGAILRFAGATAFFATMPIYSPNLETAFLAAADSALMGSFVNPLLVSVLVVSLALCVRSLALPRFPQTGVGTISWGRSAMMTAYALPTIGFYLLLVIVVPKMPDADFRHLAAILGILSGAFFVPSAVTWAQIVNPRTFGAGLQATCVIAGLTGLLNWIMTYLPTSAQSALYLLLFATAFVSYLAFAFEKRGEASCTPEETASCPEDAPLPRSRTRNAGHFLSLTLPAVIGMSMFAFFMGVARLHVFDIVSAESAGSLLAAMTIYPVVLASDRFRMPLQSVVQRLLLPICAAILLAVFAVIGEPSVENGPIVLGLGVYYFFCVAAFLALALSLVGTTAREFPPDLFISALAACFSLFSIAGLAFGQHRGFAESSNQFMPVVIVAIYCVYLIVSSIVDSWRSVPASSSRGSRGETSVEAKPSEPQQAQQAQSAQLAHNEHKAQGVSHTEPTIPNFAPSFSQRCELAATRYCLSPREREILGYLGRGHTAGYVAKTLVISENTVYTHTRNMYQKMGIGSREELLRLIEEIR